MSIKRKLDDFDNDYNNFMDIETYIDNLHQLVKMNKIKIDNNKIMNNMKNPFSFLSNDDNGLIYDSYVEYCPIQKYFYRQKMQYKYCYEYYRKKLINQLQIIELINFNLLENKLKQTYTYMYMFVHTNKHIIDRVNSFLSNTFDIDKLINNIQSNMIKYKNSTSTSASTLIFADLSILQKIIKIYHDYLCCILLYV
jgi:hypothetical protein